VQPANLYDLIQESAIWLKERGVDRIDFGIILGSGLGSIADAFEVIAAFKYDDVPHLAGTAVMGHKGELLYVRTSVGTSTGLRYGLIFRGRIHYYEGFEMWQVAYPVRILKELGAGLLITTGAAGGLNPDYREGDIVALRDHINLMNENPLRGAHDTRLGLRFPDMSKPYSQNINARLKEVAKASGMRLHEGVYAGLTGPSLETKAEYAYLHRIGADLVAMSIVPEVIVAVQCGLDIAGICVVSNICYPPNAVKETTIEAVIGVVNEAAGDVRQLLSEYIYEGQI